MIFHMIKTTNVMRNKKKTSHNHQSISINWTSLKLERDGDKRRWTLKEKKGFWGFGLFYTHKFLIFNNYSLTQKDSLSSIQNNLMDFSFLLLLLHFLFLSSLGHREGDDDD